MLHVLPLSVAADGVFTLSDRTEARARYPDPTTNVVDLDLDTLIDARVVWNTHDATYTLANQPRFTLLDFNGAAIAPAVIDTLILSSEWRWPRARFRVNENASYGELSITSLSALPAAGTPQPGAGPTGAPPPVGNATLVPNTTGAVLYTSSDTNVGSTLDLRPWTLVPKAGYQLSGGANAAGQAVLPFQRGPYGELTADYRLDVRDHLATYLSGSETSFTPLGTENVLVGLEERWRHTWSSKTETMLAAGWYLARVRAGTDQPNVDSSNPIAEAEYDRVLLRRGTNIADLRLDVRLAPYVNRLTGIIDEQVRGTVSADWSHRRWKLRALASAAESTAQGTTISARYGTAEIDAAYQVSEALTLDWGCRALLQEQNGVPAAGSTAPSEATFSQGILFFAVTVRAVKAKL